MAERKVSIIVQAKNLTKGAFKGLEKGLNGAVKLLKKAAIGAAALAASLVGAGAWFVKAASDAEETSSKFGVVFSSMGKQADDMAAKFAKDFDLSSAASQKLLSNTGDLLTGFGFTQAEAAKLSDQANRLAGDLASFTNIEGGAERASEALTKAMLGEAESVKALGIVIRQDSDEYKNLVKQAMDTRGVTEQQAKAYAALEIAVSQSKNAIGDYARTSDGVANRWKALKQSIEEARITIGKTIMDSGGIAQILGVINTKLKESIAKFKEWAKAGGINELIMKVKLFGNNFATMSKSIATTTATLVDIVTTPFKQAAEFIGKLANVFVARAQMLAKSAVQIYDFVTSGGKKKFTMDTTEYDAALELLFSDYENHTLDAPQKWQEMQDKITDIVKEGAKRESDILAEYHNNEKKRIDDLTKKEKEAAKESVRATEMSAAAKKKAADEAAKAANLEIDERAKATDKHIEKINDEIGKIQEKAKMNIEAFIAAQKQDEKAVDTKKAEEDRKKKIEAKVARGVKLSKKDQEFMKAFNDRALVQNRLKGLEAQMNLAKDAQRKLAEQKKVMQLGQKQVNLLDAIRKDQLKLLTMK